MRHVGVGSPVVPVSSDPGLNDRKGSGGLLDYSAIKGAIHAFTKSLAQPLTDDFRLRTIGFGWVGALVVGIGFVRAPAFAYLYLTFKGDVLTARPVRLLHFPPNTALDAHRGSASAGPDRPRGGTVSYTRFFAMIATSVVVMFGLMYLNSYQILDHAWFSETRMFMALVMGGAMMIVMLAYMLKMYESRWANTAIFIGGGVLILAAVGLVRSQVTVSGVDYMEGMIPHHSIAVLTSERARIEDLRVQDLAQEIIEAQRREIREMEWLIADIRENGPATTHAEAAVRPVPDFPPTPE